MMFNLFLFIIGFFSVDSFINFNSNPKNFRIYSQSNIWEKATSEVKMKARKWFISRAENKGIKWYDYLEKYKDMNTVKLITKLKIESENKDITYPNYFLKPFHGYDTGNMNWFAAMEGEASTQSVSVNYWNNVDPIDSQNWLRNNFTKIISQYQEYQPYNILDIGSSFGLGTRFIKQAYPLAIIYGLDLSPYFIAISKYLETLNPHNLNFIHANAEDIPLDNETQDLVTAQFLFHEVPKEPSQNILNQVYKVLKPGGTVAIIDLDSERLLKGLNNNIFRKWAFEITEPHIKEYYQTDICKLLEEAQFTQIEKKINDPFNSVWLGKK